MDAHTLVLSRFILDELRRVLLYPRIQSRYRITAEEIVPLLAIPRKPLTWLSHGFHPIDGGRLGIRKMLGQELDIVNLETIREELGELLLSKKRIFWITVLMHLRSIETGAERPQVATEPLQLFGVRSPHAKQLARGDQNASDSAAQEISALYAYVS